MNRLLIKVTGAVSVDRATVFHAQQVSIETSMYTKCMWYLGQLEGGSLTTQWRTDIAMVSILSGLVN